MKITSSLLKCVTVFFLVLSVILWSHVGCCGEGTKSYHYNPAGKLDPFKPFIDTVKKKAASKSPLQKISIDEIKLVGIAGSGKKRFAMVEDSKGKRHHYIIYRSTPIGLNEGRVLNILADQVIIEERIINPSGGVKTKRIIWKLRTEENEEKP
jgi:Tfp pilus assembly protein PilP